MQFSHKKLIGFHQLRGLLKKRSIFFPAHDRGDFLVPNEDFYQLCKSKNLRPTYAISRQQDPTNSLNQLANKNKPQYICFGFSSLIFFFRGEYKKLPKHHMYCEVPVYFIRCIIGLWYYAQDS